MGLSQTEKKLLEQAKKVREHAYSPYSGFKVGAALLTKKGNIHVGCNVESGDYTLSTHAEMNAIDTMVANGETEIVVILIITDFSGKIVPPCGLCRQKIAEFGGDSVKIISSNLEGEVEIHTLGELLPKAFRFKK